MTRLNEKNIAEALLNAPGWARVGISDPTPWMREDAAHELARTILHGDEARSGDDDAPHAGLVL